MSLTDLLKLAEMRLTAIDQNIVKAGETGNVEHFHYLAGSRDAYKEIYDILSGDIEILKPKK